MTPTDGSEHPPHQGEPAGPPAAGGGADAPPGSVAQEAAMLVELLSRRGWPASPGMPSAASRGPGDPPAGSGTPASSGDRPEPEGSDEDAGRAGPTEHAGPGECTCGGTTPSACRVCPVCQVIALVQQVSPDTIERVADFVGFAATALRELAAAQRERQAPRGEDDAAGPEGGA